jgi:hypothetical protein
VNSGIAMNGSISSMTFSSMLSLSYVFRLASSLLASVKMLFCAASQ